MPDRSTERWAPARSPVSTLPPAPGPRSAPPGSNRIEGLDSNGDHPRAVGWGVWLALALWPLVLLAHRVHWQRPEGDRSVAPLAIDVRQFAQEPGILEMAKFIPRAHFRQHVAPRLLRLAQSSPMGCGSRDGALRRPALRPSTASRPRFTRLDGTRSWNATDCWSVPHHRRSTS